MADNRTKFQKLTDVIIGSVNGAPSTAVQKSVTYNMPKGSDIIFSSNSKEERDLRLKQMKQQRLLSYQWKKIGYETSMEQAVGSQQVKIMYRDADLMAAWPEIGAALDIVAEEATTIKNGKILNIYSKSDRIKSVLEDLFINRLDLNIWARTIFRATAKYGNEFMYLNIDQKHGIMGWREMPVHEMSRVENGMINAYSGTFSTVASVDNLKPNEVKFVWEGHNSQIAFHNWEVAHFRLIDDSIYLPYGASWLNKARRHWRMLSMMEDAMLLYRLERSVERRIFKVNVGLIDDNDVPAYLQEFMNSVKRAPIIDPKTGQVDLRKNFLDVSADYVIPVRNGQDPSSIESLAPAQNPTSMEDIQFMENKVLCALRVPKTYLNFQEPQGKGQNLSLMDIRFCKTINAIQQSILMELNKIAIIHLYLLGFEEDLTNFTLSFNNPSNQIEMMELDNLNKRIAAATSAMAEQGSGLPLMSWHRVQKEIMGLTDKEISDLIDEMRLESALAIELQRTPEIIKRTHIFDRVDRIYGEHGAKYSDNPPGEDGGLGGGGGALPPMGGGFGDELGDIGEPGAEMGGDIGGEEGAADLESMESGPTPLSEAAKGFYTKVIEGVNEHEYGRVGIIDKSFLINEELNSMIKSLDDISANSKGTSEIEII